MKPHLFDLLLFRRFVFFRQYGDLLAVSAEPREVYHAVRFGVQCIITAAAYVKARMDVRSALSVQDVPGKDELSVSTFCTKAF